MHDLDFQALFALSPNPYMVLDRELRFVWANPAYLQVTASRIEDLLGRNIFDVFPNDPNDANNVGAARLRASFQRVLDTGRADILALIPYRVPRLTSTGERVEEERYWSATHTPVLGDDGQVRFILQHTTDVTELQKLKEAHRARVAPEQLEAGVLSRANRVQQANLTLIAELTHLRRLFEQAPGFVCFLRGPQHVFEIANRAYYQVVGHRDIVGKPVREALPEIDGQAFFDLLDRVYASGEPFVGRGMPARLQRRPGGPMEELYLDFVYQPVVEPDGKVSGIFVLGHDMTEQWAAQKELAVYREQLEELVKQRTRALEESEEERRLAEAELRQSQKMEAVGKLTGGVAHDFNNLLQIISGNLQLLQKDLDGKERASRRLRTAAEAVERGAKLSSQLLAFARRQPLAPAALHLGNLISRLEELIRRAVGERVDLRLRSDSDLWNTFVDPNQVENVILNLVINARDAMKGEGTLDIEISNARLDALYAARHPGVTGGDYVQLAISDTGCGMSQEVMERAFEPFFTTKGIGEGSGLGLSMVHGFVNQSGGHVTLSSQVGVGTTIRIFLPRSLQAEQTARTEEVPQNAPRGSETVLVVEDDPAVRATVIATLHELGYRVMDAQDGQSALEVLRSGARVDLLFSDVMMPGPVRSDELARQARALLPRIEVLFTSGYAQEAIVHGGRLDPGVSLLQKPYTQQELAVRLREVLSRQEEGRPASRRLLVVEDNIDIRAAMAETLRDLGHEVVEVESAEAARNALASGSFDVLFTDVRLPRESGLELARHAMERHPKTRVVIASGNHELATHARELTSAVLLPKPFDLDGIEAALQQALNG